MRQSRVSGRLKFCAVIQIFQHFVVEVDHAVAKSPPVGKRVLPARGKSLHKNFNANRSELPIENPAGPPRREHAAPTRPFGLRLQRPLANGCCLLLRARIILAKTDDCGRRNVEPAENIAVQCRIGGNQPETFSLAGCTFESRILPPSLACKEPQRRTGARQDRHPALRWHPLGQCVGNDPPPAICRRIGSCFSHAVPTASATIASPIMARRRRLLGGWVWFSASGINALTGLDTSLR